ncbi:galactose-specific lectin nattectin-like [Colossoma macropomum]|uniref:galactose-specific lectin nattectin-like n=1 Tax=Colossoma macropomum TaxID=42526 RepID=UPI001863AFCD|nr:galactose-specific lectin nattectin-like [Colossoma macropomum]
MAIRCSSFLLGIMCLLSVQLADTAEGKSLVTKASGWTPYGSVQFKFFGTGSSWKEAEKVCMQYGALLASVHDENEHKYIKGLIQLLTGEDRPTWLGGKKSDAGRWVWSDGSDFDFSKWTRGQPDGSGRCLQINYNGGWDDLGCTEIRSFVCARQTGK